MARFTRRQFQRLLLAGPTALGASVLGGKKSALAEDAAEDPAVGDFSFLHLSDTHLSPRPNGQAYDADGRSVRALEWIGKRSSNAIGRDGLPKVAETAEAEPDALTPAFALHTGDVFEYSIVDDCWQDWLRLARLFSCPVHYVPGNHDNTWASINHHLRESFGNDSYSFDHEGCHFVCLNSAGALDPLPCWDQRTLLWLSNDLSKVSRGTPVFLAMHHPQSRDSGFASEYDKLRFWEVIRHHHVVVMFDGHWHQVHAGQWQNIPRVNGGETFRRNTGYSSARVAGGVLRMNYHFHPSANGGARTVQLLTHHIDRPTLRFHCDFTTARFDSTKQQLLLGGVVTSTGIVSRDQPPEVSAWIDNAKQQAKSVPLEIVSGAGGKGHRFEIALDGQGLIAGRHYCTVRVATQQQLELQSQAVKGPLRLANEQAVEFNIEPDSNDYRVETYQNTAGVKSPLLLFRSGDIDLLLFADTGGLVTALDTQTMQPVWKYQASSEVYHSLSRHHDLVLVGDGSGCLHFLNANNGRVIETKSNFPPIFGGSLFIDHVAYLGDANGQVYAIDLGRRELLWSKDVATFAIEQAPVHHSESDLLIVCAWDGCVHAIDRSTGETAWKSPSPTGQEKLFSRYYGPADCPPVPVGDEVWVTDRGYTLGRYRSHDGKYLGRVSDQVASVVAATSAQPPTRSVIVRRLDDKLVRLDELGNMQWESKVPLGRVPTAPTLNTRDGVGRQPIGVVSDTGVLTLLSANDGQSFLTHAVAPSLFVLAPLAVSADQSQWFSASMDGVVTKITLYNQLAT